MSDPSDQGSRRSFGEHLLGLRRALRLSSAELAERSGLEPAVVEAIEADARSPELVELIALSEGLGMRLSTIFRLLETDGQLD